jgi:beta-glucosidase
VCVLLHGGAVALGAARTACDAIVDLWVPGQAAGTGLADVLLGSYSPAGRSPITFYRATSDLPDFAEYDEYPSSSSNGTTYRHYIGREPDFAFGFGLSYTTFEYSELAVPGTVEPCADVNLSVVVTNTGTVTSDEVVQVYHLLPPRYNYHDRNSGLTAIYLRFARPVRILMMTRSRYAWLPDATVPAPRIRLVAFERVRAIAPGKSLAVALTVRPESHAVVLEGGPSVYDADVAVQSGRLLLSVGGGQPTGAGGGTLSATVAVPKSSLLRNCP